MIITSTSANHPIAFLGSRWNIGRVIINIGDKLNISPQHPTTLTYLMKVINKASLTMCLYLLHGIASFKVPKVYTLESCGDTTQDSRWLPYSVFAVCYYPVSVSTPGSLPPKPPVILFLILCMVNLASSFANATFYVKN